MLSFETVILPLFVYNIDKIVAEVPQNKLGIGIRAIPVYLVV
jgi:hypothetical protein